MIPGLVFVAWAFWPLVSFASLVLKRVWWLCVAYWVIFLNPDKDFHRVMVLVKCVFRYWEPTLRKGDGLGEVRGSTGEEYQSLPPGYAKSLGNWG